MVITRKNYPELSDRFNLQTDIISCDKGLFNLFRSFQCFTFFPESSFPYSFYPFKDKCFYYVDEVDRIRLLCFRIKYYKYSYIVSYRPFFGFKSLNCQYIRLKVDINHILSTYYRPGLQYSINYAKNF